MKSFGISQPEVRYEPIVPGGGSYWEPFSVWIFFRDLILAWIFFHQFVRYFFHWFPIFFFFWHLPNAPHPLPAKIEWPVPNQKKIQNELV